MRVLVDTHVLIWAVLDSPKLSKKAKYYLTDPDSEIYFSAASIWEIAVKRRRRPQDIPLTAADALRLFPATGYRELPVAARHGLAVDALPDIHGDPFDRILIAQAKSEDMSLMTHDHAVIQYRAAGNPFIMAV